MSNRSYRLLLLLGALGSFLLALGFFLRFEGWEELQEQAEEMIAAVVEIPTAPDGEAFLGLSVIRREQLADFRENPELKLDGIRFNGLPAAADTQSGTLYLSLAESGLEGTAPLTATLETSRLGESLRILESPALQDVARAAREGESLSLLLFRGRQYRTVELVLTTLPVIAIEGGNFSHEADYWEEFQGNFYLWDGQRDQDVESMLQWHRRGGTTMWMDKRSWKLSLKKDRMDNNHCDLLGLGADDDWILNPMCMDDLSCRERFAGMLWNRCAIGDDWNYKMSTGEYVELVVGGRYEGLYLLQRRIDEKYLDLDRETSILIKGTRPPAGADIREGYEVIWSPYGEEDAYRIFYEALAGENGSRFHRESFVDTSLFLDYLSAYDNMKTNNIFFLLEKTDTGHELLFLPWDTDMSLGVVWEKEGGFSVGYEKSLGASVRRMEFESFLQQEPELEEQMARRWQQLRQTMYSEDTLKSVLTELESQSGLQAARAREEQRWGLYYGGRDSLEQFWDHVLQRVKILDEFYNTTVN